MPLINSTTRLNKLKYSSTGGDRYDEGWSGQPYIKKPIPGADDTFVQQLDGTPQPTGGVDFLLRGGLLSVNAAATDVSRLTQMLFSTKSPNGFEFIAKQNILSRNSVKTEASFGVGYAGGGLNQGVYLPVGTLAQALVDPVATGITNLFGLNPLTDDTPLTKGFQPSNNGGVNSYFATVNMQNTSNDVEDSNRLVNLQNVIQLNIEGKTKGGNITLNPGGFNQTILQYGGGPGSILGIGKTNINFTDQRTGRSNAQLINSGFLEGVTALTLDANIASSGNYSIYKRPSPLYPLQKDSDYRGLSDVWNNSIFNLAYAGYGGFEPITRAYDGLSNISPYIYGHNDEDFTWPDGGSGRAAAMAAGFKNPVGPDFYNVYARPVATFGNDLELSQISKGNLFISGSGVSGIFAKTFPDYSLNLMENLVVKLDVNSYADQDPGGLYNFKTSVYKIDDPSTTENEFMRSDLPKIQQNNTAVLTQEQLYQRPIVSQTGLNNVSDFRINTSLGDITQLSSSQVLSISPDYTTKNKNIRVNQGDPGLGTNLGVKDVLHYGVAANTLEALDQINALPMYEASAADFDGDDGGKATNDLVKFRIAVINNDKANGLATYIHFRAFIDEFSDNYTSKWNSVQYVGRGEELHNYAGFGREISLGWTVYAQSKAELIPMYKKLNYLASTLAPDYNPAGFMRGNIVRLTLGGYLYEQPGIIKSLTYTAPMESTWEIAIDEKGKSDPSVRELPHMIKVTGVTFVPIQEFIPAKADSLLDPTQKYISLANNTKTTNYSDVYRSYKQQGAVLD